MVFFFVVKINYYRVSTPYIKCWVWLTSSSFLTEHIFFFYKEKLLYYLLTKPLVEIKTQYHIILFQAETNKMYS